MLHSIIEQIFYRKRGDAESIKVSKEYKRLLDEICKLEDDFTKDFSEDQQKKYDEIFLLQCGLQSEVALSHFAEGLKIGMRLAFESFVENNEEK